jgi:hypothetical protein
MMAYPEDQSLTTRHSRTKQCIVLNKTKSKDQLALLQNRINTDRHHPMRSSFNVTKSSTELGKNNLFHKKRNSQSSYSTFMNMYQHRKEKESMQDLHIKANLNYTVKNEIEEEHDDVIPEEAENLENDTASANLK